MAVSHKYKTFNQLLEEVAIDFSTYSLEGMIDAAQLIKVAIRVNYDLGLRINRTKETIVEIEHNKGRLPFNFYTLNYAFLCGEYTVVQDFPSGTHVESVSPDYVPYPGLTGPCTEATCTDVCILENCDGKEGYKLVQYKGANQYHTYSVMLPLRIRNVNGQTCNCPNANVESPNVAEIKDGFLLTNFTTGNVYVNYQATMEDEDANLLVLDHPYCNEYYEYALKEKILENLMFAGENVSDKLGYIQQKLRAARNNALGFVNTPNFEELRKMWEVNRKAQQHNYYNMYKSIATYR